VDVLATQVSPTLCWVRAVPDPEADNVAGELVAFPETEIRAEVAPLLAGLKFTPTEILCPAAIVFGKVKPLKVNSGFVVVAEEIVTAFDPAVNVVVLLDVLPTTTLPELRLVGEIVRVPALVVLLALPDNVTVALAEFVEKMLNSPVKFPTLFGTNWIMKVTLLPGAILEGNAIPENLKGPVIEI